MSNVIPTAPASEDTAGTEVALIDENDAVTEAIQAIRSGNALAYNSIVGDDWDAKLAALNAVTNSEPLRDHLGQPIAVTNIIIQSVVIETTDPKSGEVTGSRQPRIILLDDSGNAFHAISGGLLKSVGNIIGIMREPSTWTSPVSIEVTKEKGKRGDYMTAKLSNVVKLAPKK